MDNYPGHRGNQLAPGVAGFTGVPSSERAASALERIATCLEHLVAGRSAPKARAPRRLGSPRPSRLIAAQSFITVVLRENGPMPWEDILARGREYKHTKGTLENARREVAHCQVIEGRWFWRLKDEGMGSNGEADRLR